MNLMPILEAAIFATGGNPDADPMPAEDLERAQKALRAVDAHLDKALGYTPLASVTVTSNPERTT